MSMTVLQIHLGQYGLKFMGLRLNFALHNLYTIVLLTILGLILTTPASHSKCDSCMGIRPSWRQWV